MDNPTNEHKRLISRRQVLRSGALLATIFAMSPIMAACNTNKAATPVKPTRTPSARSTRDDDPGVASGVNLKYLPRNRILKAMSGGTDGVYTDHEVWNCYSLGGNHQSGPQMIYEPLAYYNALADKEIMWLAENYKYSGDFRELTIKTRSGVSWSDGQPFSAVDVAYTFNALKELGAKVRWGLEVERSIETATATDASTVVVQFKAASPRFFDLVTYKYDTGLFIVPKHVFEGKDWATFTHFDLSKGWPVTTGPWKVVQSTSDEKTMDLREDWWAARAGLAKMPAVQRVSYIPWPGEQKAIRAIKANEVDITQTLSPNVFADVFKQNKAITTFTEQKPPFGYVDWWPISLWVNHEVAPFGDKDVRWALSYFIDRKPLIDAGLAGSGSTFPLPFPSYPGLKPYADAVKPILEKYNTLEFNPKKGEAILTGKGWKKDIKGMWADSQGKPLTIEIIGTTAVASIGSIIAETLKVQGVDATFSVPSDAMSRFQRGKYSGMISGHIGSVRDPYNTLRLYHSGEVETNKDISTARTANLSRWRNPEYDKITDNFFATDMNDKASLTALWKQAMEIWIPELPDIVLTEFYQRPPMNTTYWKNWPNAKNAYITSSCQYLTWPIVLWNLEAVR